MNTQQSASNTLNAALAMSKLKEENKKPALCAFPYEGRDGYYNVWRYDTPSTQNILFRHKAKSREEAVNDALKKLKA
jgi:hypothetical protein